MTEEAPPRLTDLAQALVLGAKELEAELASVKEVRDKYKHALWAIHRHYTCTASIADIVSDALREEEKDGEAT